MDYMWQLMSYTDGRKRHEFSPCVGKITGRGHGNPLQYSCLNNPMDRGDWQATVPDHAPKLIQIPTK